MNYLFYPENDRVRVSRFAETLTTNHLKEPEFDRESGEYIDGYSVKMSPYGRLNEIDFLSRIYDLDRTLPEACIF